jgi:uncharacterized protein (DUF169 family)
MTASCPAEPLPVGVSILPDASRLASVAVYEGASYCDAVRRAGTGEVLRVLPGSIQVCGWAPVVLGLKSPDGAFESGLAPRLRFPVAGLLLAPMDRFPGEPQVVVVRSELAQIQQLVALVGERCLWDSEGREPDCSAGVHSLAVSEPPGNRGL